MRSFLVKIAVLFLTVSFFAPDLTYAQQLKAGFNKQEYIELLKISSQQGDTINIDGPNYLGPPEDYERIYRSPVLGLKNRWDLWINKQRNTLVVSIRGTTKESESWLENFYCAMVPAIGTIQLNDTTKFAYHFADDPKATVHVGWTIGIAYLAPDILAKVQGAYEKDHIKHIYIMGHSQGGALAYLLNSLLRYKIKSGELPHDLIIKTYCSAAPKPGNLYYAYDFDFINRGGWAYNVVNAADWVPETPFSLQSLADFNEQNPFEGAEQALKKQKPFYVRWYLKHAFRKLDKSTKKSQKTFRKYLGNTLFKQVKKVLPELKEPEYALSMNYMRAGNPIVLQPDSAYYELYPDTGDNIFVHHAMKAYLYLLQKQYE